MKSLKNFYNNKIFQIATVFSLVSLFWILSFSMYGFEKIAPSFLTMGMVFYGLIFTSLRYMEKDNILKIFFISLSLSVATFSIILLKMEQELSYSGIEFYVNGIILLNIIIYSALNLWFYWSNIVLRISESFILLQTVSFFYLMTAWIDSSLYNNKTLYIISIFWFIISIPTFIHSFSYIKFTKNIQIYFSIYSAMTMFVIGLSYFTKIMDNIGSEKIFLKYNLYIYPLEYFIFGLSILFIFSNIALAFNMFFWDKHKNFDDNWECISKAHKGRFLNIQSKIQNSAIVLMLSSFIYILNYHFNFLSVYQIIFLVFFGFSYLGLILSFRKK